MKTNELYKWMSDNRPTPFELKSLYSQLGKELTTDQAWMVCYIHNVQCTGPNGRGYTYFTDKLGELLLLPPGKEKR